jgi:C-terminal processing protease CtpA/Prc
MNLRVLLRLVPAVAALAAWPLQGQSIPASAAQEDFDVLWRSIKEAHGGLHRFVPAVDLDRKIAAYRLRLDKPITVIGLSGILSESLAELRDGHARLEFDSATSAAVASAALLPLRVAIEDDRVVVTYNDSPADTTIRPGMEVVSINGHATSDLVRSLLPAISGDGFIETGKRTSLSREFAPRYWLYVEQAGSYRVVARDGQRTVTATLPGILERTRRQATNPVNATFAANLARLDGPVGNVALEFIGDGSVARLRVRAFDGQAFIENLDSAFRLLRDRGTRSLVLDLRGNGGGVDLEGAKLVSYFVERPFRYFDYIHLRSIAPSFATWLPRTFESTRAGTVPHPAGGFRVTGALHRGVDEQQPAGTPFTGKLVVLIDGGTFSTAADVAAQLRSLGRGTFIGEETAGGYEGNTSGLNASIVLPNSRLRLRIMMYGYWNAVKPPATRGRGTMPDHPDVRRVADVLRGVDPAMERALMILR